MGYDLRQFGLAQIELFDKPGEDDAWFEALHPLPSGLWQMMFQATSVEYVVTILMFDSAIIEGQGTLVAHLFWQMIKGQRQDIQRLFD